MRKLHFCLFVAAALVLSACNSADKKSEVVPVQPPLMGWSSWNAYMVDISDSIIMHQADLIVEKGLKDAGYGYVNIDDGFFGYRDSLGYMVPHPQRFPSGVAGMRKIVDHIHGLGLMAGIYSDAGDNTCGSNYNKDVNGLGAGLYNHDVQDVERYFNQWDFDFIKIDFCGGVHLQLDEQERYTQIRNVMDSVANKHVRLNICRWDFPGTWVKGISESWRISHDIRPVWSSIKSIVQKNLYLSAYAGDGHYNDMDMLAVGYNIKPSPFWEDGLGLTYNEEEAHFALWCIMSSPLLLGCDVAYIPEETMDIITNKELIAVNQDPLGLQAHVVQHNDETYVFAKDILELRGETRAVALYNPSDVAYQFVVDAATLEMTGDLKVRDLNRQEDLGVCQAIQMTVPAHSAKVLKVEGARIEPTLYEAEWGYCPDFTAIRNTGVKYVTAEGASARAVATNIGGAESNYLQWNNVYSENGGEYTLCFTLMTEADRANEVMIYVNGEETTMPMPATDEASVEIQLDVQLKNGVNDVRIGNPSAVIPSVDKLVVAKK